jgi:hypothetical protein
MGSWTPAPSGFQLRWDEQDLFLLRDDGVYDSRLSSEGRLSLTERYELGVGIGPMSAPTGLNVRADASRDKAPVGQLADRERVRILCVTQGEYASDPDSDRWYNIAYHGTQKGYVLAACVEQEGETSDEQIPGCE